MVSTVENLAHWVGTHGLRNPGRKTGTTQKAYKASLNLVRSTSAERLRSSWVKGIGY